MVVWETAFVVWLLETTYAVFVNCTVLFPTIAVTFVVLPLINCGILTSIKSLFDGGAVNVITFAEIEYALDGFCKTPNSVNGGVGIGNPVSNLVVDKSGVGQPVVKKATKKLK